MLLLLPENKTSTIELHYWLKGGSHTMDAFVQNKCELEFLYIAKEIANTLGHDIYLETEPLAEGGIKRWFKVLVKGENKNAVITTAVTTAAITALTVGVIVTPISTAIDRKSTRLNSSHVKISY